LGTHAKLGSTIRAALSVLLAQMRAIQRKLTGLAARRGIVSPRSLDNDNLVIFGDELGEIGESENDYLSTKVGVDCRMLSWGVLRPFRALVWGKITGKKTS
jgi:hypothetical protein